MSAIRVRPTRSLFENSRLYDWWGRWKFRVFGAAVARLLPDVRSTFENGLAMIEREGSAPLLDVGGGRGELAALRATSGALIVVLERSRVQCQLLRQQFPGLQLVRGDACHLPFRDRAFDTTLLRAVLHHVSDPEIALREARRVSRQSIVLDLIQDRRRAVAWAERTWAYLQDGGAQIQTRAGWMRILSDLGQANVQLNSSPSLEYFLYFHVKWAN